MLTCTIKEIITVTEGTLLQGTPDVLVDGVATDSRKVKSGDIFVALQGQQVDGHDFIQKAVELGAVALLVAHRVETVPATVPVIQVTNTLQALQELAAYNRLRKAIPVVAITGSNGKTSTKDMIAAVLQIRYHTLKTEANYNNELGLPLTLLNLQQEHQAAVVEMGMRGSGEIDFLAGLAKPTGAVITTIGEAHLERLGSVHNIALAKTEVLEHIREEGFALLNGDSPWLRELATRCRGKVWFYSLQGNADIVAHNIRPEEGGVRYEVTYPGGAGEIYLPVPGSHNVMNSLAAIGVGLQLGLTFEEITRGLAQVALSHMRLEILQSHGMTIINDTYNASPSSTKAAIGVLQETNRGRKIAVLGNMYELGAMEEVGHREVGEAAARAGVDHLIAVGNLAQWIAAGGITGGLTQEQVHHCEDNSQAIAVLRTIIKSGDTILVKGSRGMTMEQIVKELT
ncbi:UDP-N-acetylmuramoyl-tripeptide--D-alanyl-D-alanine ligase [Desulforamulus aeronauticus]|uniref:UDP-N-acetylmuramoyl-tripeptide--D-alanyl-D-alanine ligase n=1 Tax=Desulforamulus aeronauticus DSM 10349 TaxID=1121421 RepID=A0A1M6QVU9_9FIRM|nr:UDP-N-acetylmuramoyl-tripeptide--D-alanyl-D-alanine ligase [Desulforamulus aeronauticus]SHK24392.1 UDP-N-acetylmuramoyl-tripeptide--D-alanyl-D-alanine ligase [Desulforamulus aeronauticus DSM 10349]